MSNQPTQFGFGVPLGCEAIAHAVRTYISSSHSNDHILVKLDFSNAFNSLRRDRMLEAVSKELPSAYNYIYSSNAQPSLLSYGDRVIASSEGIQQGDPLGPLLFSLTINTMVKSLQSELNCWYLDDGTLAGGFEEVQNDVNTVITEGSKLGLRLHINISKSEICCLGGATVPHPFFSNMPVLDKEHLTLLGSPVGGTESVEVVLSDKLNVLNTLATRLKVLDSHDALYLLRHCFSTPKLMYILRSAPCFSSDLLGSYDSCLREILEYILNVSLDDTSWMQATLPVRDGGLGIQRATTLATPAFISSFMASTALQEMILPPGVARSTAQLDKAVTLWKANVDVAPPASAVQREWCTPLYAKQKMQLLQKQTNEADAKRTARLKAISSPNASDWLNALPAHNLGLKLNNEEIRLATALRLGIQCCQPHLCRSCNTAVDERGTHGLSCKYSAGRHPRHSEVNNLIMRALRSAGIASVLEPSGLFRVDGKRPDGMTMSPWSKGRCLVWDFTCSDTLASSHVNKTSLSACASAADAEDAKIRKYSTLVSQYEFAPIGVETLGSWGPCALRVLKEIGKRITVQTCESRSTIYLMQRLSIAVQRGNAQSMFATIPSVAELNELADL
jgi:hypothetical protein